MKTLRLFLIANTSMSSLAFLCCALGAISGSIYALAFSVAFGTNALVGMVAYRTLHQLQRIPASRTTTPAKQPTAIAKPLDRTIIAGMLKRGFSRPQIEALWTSGRMTVC